jgi:Bucentaur or craniofacial development
MSKRKAVDEAFYRMFHYQWGESVSLDRETCSDFERELIQIFGPSLAGKISAGSKRTLTRQRRTLSSTSSSTQPILALNYSSSESIIQRPARLPTMAPPTPVESLSAVPSATTIAATPTIAIEIAIAPTPPTAATKSAVNVPRAAVAKPKVGIDSVLAQIAEPTKTSTVKKTSDDWEAFKESDKQLQDELEKKAQSKDALLVRQDFLVRVDNRTFEIEKEERERERARRGMNN